MQAEVTVRVVLTDARGRHVSTVERTRYKDAGDNPRFLATEVMPVARDTAEETVRLAVHAVEGD